MQLQLSDVHRSMLLYQTVIVDFMLIFLLCVSENGAGTRKGECYFYPSIFFSLFQYSFDLLTTSQISRNIGKVFFKSFIKIIRFSVTS